MTNTSGRSSPVPGLADLNPNVALPSIFHAGRNAAEFSTKVTWLMDALTCKRNINCARYLLLGITPSCQVISSNKLHFGLDLFKGGVHAAKPPANAKRELTRSGRCPAREGVSMVSSNEKEIATVYTDQKFHENMFCCASATYGTAHGTNPSQARYSSGSCRCAGFRDKHQCTAQCLAKRIETPIRQPESFAPVGMPPGFPKRCHLATGIFFR